MPYLCNAEVMALLHDYSKKLFRERRRFSGIYKLTNEKSLHRKGAGFFIELAQERHPGGSRDP
jgi:hypothetical protein